MRIRTDESSNYKAVFLDGNTLRMKIDYNLPFQSPKYPEIEDVAINNVCFANCSYCYVSATKHGNNFTNISEKAIKVWGEVDINNRPFQIAIGGAGEPTIHPQFIQFLKTVKDLEIMPNYTTNGMHLNDAILNATQDYCGGLAVSLHPHIEKVFHKAIDAYSDIKTELNVHIILGEENSLERLQRVYDMYQDKIKYFVLLPYQAVGRAKEIETIGVWEHTMKWVASVNSKQFAFGALFYDFLKKFEHNLNIDMYEPEMFSGYRIMDDSYKTIRKSSYNTNKRL